MQTIAIGLENGNPAAYLLILILLYPPVMIIFFAITDKIKSFINKRKNYKNKEKLKTLTNKN